MFAMAPDSDEQVIVFEEYDSDLPCSTENFQVNADILDGVSGKRPIDTTFENNDYQLLRGEHTNVK